MAPLRCSSITACIKTRLPSLTQKIPHQRHVRRSCFGWLPAHFKRSRTELLIQTLNLIYFEVMVKSRPFGATRSLQAETGFILIAAGSFRFRKLCSVSLQHKMPMSIPCNSPDRYQAVSPLRVDSLRAVGASNALSGC
jgi:hypothetical protein